MTTTRTPADHPLAALAASLCFYAAACGSPAQDSAPAAAITSCGAAGRRPVAPRPPPTPRPEPGQPGRARHGRRRRRQRPRRRATMPPARQPAADPVRPGRRAGPAGRPGLVPEALRPARDGRQRQPARGRRAQPGRARTHPGGRSRQPVDRGRRLARPRERAGHHAAQETRRHAGATLAPHAAGRQLRRLAETDDRQT
jgi:hypothetical protein